MDVAWRNTDEILESLKRAGYKFTGKRREIASIFAGNPNRTFTAREVFEQVRSVYPRLSFDTVYRTLALLEEHQIIERVESGEEAARYRLACPARTHHHHLVCIGCGQSIVLNECPIEALRDKLGGFQVVGHQLAIYGYCATCGSAGQP